MDKHIFLSLFAFFISAQAPAVSFYKSPFDGLAGIELKGRRICIHMRDQSRIGRIDMATKSSNGRVQEQAVWQQTIDHGQGSRAGNCTLSPKPVKTDIPL